MNSENKRTDTNDTSGADHGHEDRTEDRQQLRNPRWFFPADPDKFFSDLLMEQSEQA